MITNTHQSIEEIVNSATSEQRILWDHARLICGENSAVRPVYYQGLLANSEISVYSANKAYLCYDLYVSNGNMLPAVSGGYFYTYNMVDAVEMIYQINLPYWDATAAAVKYTTASMNFKNMFFSRIGAMNNWNYLRFIGFRLTR